MCNLFYRKSKEYAFFDLFKNAGLYNIFISSYSHFHFFDISHDDDDGNRDYKSSAHAFAKYVHVITRATAVIPRASQLGRKLDSGIANRVRQKIDPTRRAIGGTKFNFFITNFSELPCLPRRRQS